MPRFHLLFTPLSLLALPSTLLATEISDANSNELVYNDPLNIFYRKRNAHACMMSIVFLVLYPLGAISLHLPLPPFLRNLKTVPKVHVPIQILGLAMMIGAIGLGIDVANDLHFFTTRSVPAHVVIGLLATSMIIVIQPAMGLLHHWRYGRKGQKSWFGYVHRWNGRVAIVLGMINQGLGFQLVGIGRVVHANSLIRNFLFLSVLGGLWFALVMWDWERVGWRVGKSVARSEEEKRDVEVTSTGVK